jgi:hypothetical protein
MNPTVPYWFAILLGGSTLVFYLLSAFWNRSKIEPISETAAEEDFNLGLPDSNDRESLFAIALVAAGTSLSTVFVFFLTATALFGWWILLSPVMFLVGNILMFAVYRRIRSKGYFEESDTTVAGAAGLVPFIVCRLTGSRGIGYFVLLLSLINLISVLVLELVVGVEVITYLADHAAGVSVSGGVKFTIFAISMGLLLGYVYVGGFRAVVASDVWQMKLMRIAIALSAVCLAWICFSRPAPSSAGVSLLGPPWGLLLWGFLLNVTIANLFVPMAQESSWQRFRAFAFGDSLNERKALKRSLKSAGALWTGLIITSVLLLYALPSDRAGRLSSMSGVLEQLKSIDDALFPLFVFPLMVVAGLSALFSTADTCVSAILYLLEFPLSSAGEPRRRRLDIQQTRLRPSYYVAMGLLFVGSLGVYGFVRWWFNPTVLQLVFSVFSNLVVIAPTVLTAMWLRPFQGSSPRRTYCVAASLSLGFVCYWIASLSAIVRGPEYLWLSQLSIALGLLGATLPLLPLWFEKVKK